MNVFPAANRTSRALGPVFLPCSLSRKALRKVTLLLASLLAVAGMAAGMATFLRPSPGPQFLGTWLLGSGPNWSLWEAAADRDRAALTSEALLGDRHSLANLAPSREQLRNHLAQLEHVGAHESVVLYLAARANLGAKGQLEVLLAGSDSAESMRLSELLSQFAACRAARKWLVLDLVAADRAPWTASAEELARQLPRELAAVEDPRRLVLSHVGQPLVSETWHRTAIGYYLEEALGGAADGWFDGRSDGRVTVVEASRYACQRVRHWSETLRGEVTGPVLHGAGEDFDLAAVSLRRSGTAEVFNDPAAAAYPHWLAKAWDETAVVWDRQAITLRPRLYRRWNEALLRAEQQVRGGLDAQSARAALQFALAQYRQELTCSQQLVTSPPGYSVYMFHGAAFNKSRSAAVAAMETLFGDLESQSEGLPDDKAAAVRHKLIDGFLSNTKNIPDNVMAAAAIAYIESSSQYSPDQTEMINRLVKLRQPQPQFVETLLLDRAAKVAASEASALDGMALVGAMRVARWSAACMPAGPQWSWTGDTLDTAAQAAHNGEYLLLRPGFAPPATAGEQLAIAARSFRTAAAAQEAIANASQMYRAAMLDLPALSRQYRSVDFDRDSWSGAVARAEALSVLLQSAGERPPAESRNLAVDVDQLDWAAAALSECMARLTRTTSEDRLARLLVAVDENEATAANLSAARNMLSSPRWKRSQREQLWSASNQLSAALHAQVQASPLSLEELTPGESSMERQSAAAPGWAASLLADAALSLDLCRLGGAQSAEVEKVRTLAQQLPEAAVYVDQHDAIARELRAELRTLERELLKLAAVDANSWQQMRLGSVLAAGKLLTGLDDPARNPTTAMRVREITLRNRWLAEYFAYRAADDTPTLYAALARRYAAAAGAETAAPLQFAGAASLRRPMQHATEVTTAVQWHIDSAQEAISYRILCPEDSLSADGKLQMASGAAALQITLRQLSASADAVRDRGVLLEVNAAGRNWHWPLAFEQPPGAPLQILASPTANAADARADAIRLRPTPLPQSRYLFAANHSNADLTAAVEIPGVGQARAHVPAGQVVPLNFVPLADADKLPGQPFSDAVNLQISTVTGTEAPMVQSFPLQILSPQQYVRVTAIRYLPGDEIHNQLRVALTAHGLPPGPPCQVSLDLSADRIAGLQSITGGTRRGLLPADGTELVLTADGLVLTESADLLSEFSLAVDGVARAITLEGVLPRRGDPTSPRQVLEPRLEIEVPQYALAGEGFQPRVFVGSAPAQGRLRIRIGQRRGVGLIAELEQLAPHVDRSQVQFAPHGDGSLVCQVTQSPWPFAFDTTGMAGPKLVQADLLDADGTVLASASRTVIFDDTPPERASFRLPPIEALVKQPLPLQVQAGDAVSGVERVFLFAGRPVDNKPPADARLIEARWNEDSRVWEADLPPAKELGPLEATAQVVNHVGLATYVTTPIRIVKELTQPSGEIRGQLLEGPRPQPNLQVQLLDAAGAPVATATTDLQGRFLFTDLKPGSYVLAAVKESSGRKASREVAVNSGALRTVTLELAL